jgi:hypothetical protein
MGAAIGIALVALVVVIIALGLSPILFVPVAIVAVVIVLRPVVGLLSRGGAGERTRRTTPSTSEASYEPVSDPSER